ncbi:hypothetical protein FA09DRAFT_60539 [Tilletiopsis washingtonensis]|jgi:hypothetical protein|uniref:BHLH domain-containing protein n=1 Tax=Tilletiopsis washingtonensis TaxID=58919 RepID=A0A316Z755_9BASI|nr:hypothetical protein FA09DRAFT_60539 [Tilletiopsis washingtonensis]PWN97096.1 hypothetical protein FA09DRAFT_60539 [Tilletiopsis washingtonensis]
MPPARRAADAPPGAYATQVPAFDERQHWHLSRPGSQSGDPSAPQLVRSRVQALPADAEMRAAPSQQQTAGPSQPAPPRLLYQIRLEQQQQQQQQQQQEQQQRQQEHERMQRDEHHARRYEHELRQRDEDHHARQAYEHQRRQHEAPQHAPPRPYGMVGAGSPEEAFGASAPLFPVRRDMHSKADTQHGAPLHASSSLPQMHPSQHAQAMLSPADERRLPSQFGPAARERRVRTLSGATSSRLPASLDDPRGVVHERLRSAVSDEAREASSSLHHHAERPLSRSADSDWERRYVPAGAGAEAVHSPAEHHPSRPAMPSMLRDVRLLDERREPMQGHAGERSAAMHTSSPGRNAGGGAPYPGPPPGGSAPMSARSISSSSMDHTSAGTPLHGYADEYGTSSAPFTRPRALTAAEKRRGNSAASQSRRMAHLMSEQRRREHINQGFEELRSCVPTCGDGVESKATILRRAIEVSVVKVTASTVGSHLDSTLAISRSSCAARVATQAACRWSSARHTPCRHPCSRRLWPPPARLRRRRT